VKDFLESHPFNEKRIGSTKYLGLTFPYINFLSFILMKIKVIPQFKKLITEKEQKPFDGIIELYHFASESNKRIELVHPL